MRTCNKSYLKFIYGVCITILLLTLMTYSPGCRNVRQCHHKYIQSFSGLHSLGRSYSTDLWYIGIFSISPLTLHSGICCTLLNLSQINEWMDGRMDGWMARCLKCNRNRIEESTQLSEDCFNFLLLNLCQTDISIWKSLVIEMHKFIISKHFELYFAKY